MNNLRHIVLKLDDGEGIQETFLRCKKAVFEYGIVYRLFGMDIQAYTLSQNGVYAFFIVCFLEKRFQP